jgi:DNA invertase Pin-like site-specific DNA recombinase
MKAKRVGIYLRVSKGEQTTDNQRVDLERVAAQRGWQVTEWYVDHGVSGAKRREKRPQLDRLLKDAAYGKLDVVAAWSVDRLGRTMVATVCMLAQLQEQNVAVYLHQQQVDGTTAAGRAMLQMCCVFAEFERSLIVERIHAGLARARAQGKALGRPPVAAAVEERIRQLRNTGMGKRRIARECGCGVSTVQRVLKEGPGQGELAAATAA